MVIDTHGIAKKDERTNRYIQPQCSQVLDVRRKKGGGRLYLECPKKEPRGPFCDECIFLKKEDKG